MRTLMSVTSELIITEAPADGLTTVSFIRGVGTVDHTITIPVTIDTTSRLALELTVSTWSYSQMTSHVSAIIHQ